MNFLAHFFLSHTDHESIIGNFIADQVKGSRIHEYTEGIIKGIRWHRMVDEYTDKHPVVRETQVLLRSDFRKYSGVVLDMYYDHFLGKHWSTYSNESLNDFTGKVYNVLVSNLDMLPQRSQYILTYMVKQNWLLNYRTFEGLHSALSGIASRTVFHSNMEFGVSHLKSNYAYYNASFKQFFPELLDFCRTQS